MSTPSESHRFFWPVVVITVLLVMSTGLALFHFARGQARLQARITDCKSRLKGLGVYLALYESRFGCYPATLDDMRRHPEGARGGREAGRDRRGE